MGKKLRSAFWGLATIFGSCAAAAAADEETAALITRAQDAIVEPNALQKAVAHFSIPFSPMFGVPESVPKDSANTYMTQIVETLVTDADSKDNLERFLNQGGKFILYRHMQNYGSYSPQTTMISLDTSAGVPMMMVTMDHELEHFDRHIRGHFPPSDYESLDKVDAVHYSFTDYLQSTFFDEAIAQTKATDFAYGLYLQGNAEPLRRLLYRGRDSYGEDVGYLNAMAAAYIAALHELDRLPLHFRIEDLPARPGSEDLPFETRRSMAQAAAFETWLGSAGAMDAYAYKTAGQYERALEQVGQYPGMDIYTRADAPEHPLASITIDAASIEPEMDIGGTSYYPYVPEMVLTDDFTRAMLPEEIKSKEAKLLEAVALYNSEGTPPEATIRPETILYEKADVDTFLEGGYQGSVTLDEFLQFRRDGLLDVAADYMRDNDMDNGTAMTIAEYASLHRAGKIPGLSETVEPIEQYPWLYISLSLRPRMEFALRVFEAQGGPVMKKAGLNALGAMMEVCEDMDPKAYETCKDNVHKATGRMIRKVLSLPDEVSMDVTLASNPDVRKTQAEFYALLQPARQARKLLSLQP